MNFSVGSISQTHGKLAQALQAPLAEAAATLCHARVVHLKKNFSLSARSRARGYKAFFSRNKRSICAAGTARLNR